MISDNVQIKLFDYSCYLGETICGLTQERGELVAMWEASGETREASGGRPEAPGLQRRLGARKLNTSLLKCKSSIKMSILRGVFEGRYHQVQ